jgi:hypothetical protein
MENYKNVTSRSRNPLSANLVGFTALKTESPSQRSRQVLRSRNTLENVSPPLHPIDQPTDDNQRGGFGKSHNRLQFGASQRVPVPVKQPACEQPVFHQSMISLASTVPPHQSNDNTFTAEHYGSRTVSSQGSHVSTGSGTENYELMISTEDFLVDLYPSGHEYNKLGKRHVIRQVLKNMVNQQILTVQMPESTWRTSMCWSLMCQYGMAPRPITNCVYLAALGSNPVTSVHSRLRLPGAKLGRAGYGRVVYLSAVGSTSDPASRPELQAAQLADLSDRWLCVHVKTVACETNGLSATPLSVQQTTDAVQFLLKQFKMTSGKTTEEVSQALILCESADLMLPAVSIAAAYGHVIRLEPLCVPRHKCEDHEDDDVLLLQDTTMTSCHNQSHNETVDNASEQPSDDPSNELAPVIMEQHLSLRVFDHVLCVVPELLVRVQLLFTDSNTCSTHLPHIHQFAAAVRCVLSESCNADSPPEYSDRMGTQFKQVTDWTHQASESARLWLDEYTELAEDLQEMSASWPKQSLVSLFNERLCIVEANDSPMSSIIQLEPTHVVTLTAAKNYVQLIGLDASRAPTDACTCAPHNMNMLSVLSSCASVRSSIVVPLLNVSNLATCQPKAHAFEQVVRFLADAYQDKKSRVLMVCSWGVHAWMGAVLFSEYVHLSVGTRYSKLLCALAATTLHSKLAILDQALVCRPDASLMLEWANCIAHKKESLRSYVKMAQTQRHEYSLLKWVKGIHEQHTLCAFTSHNCAKMPWTTLDNTLRRLACHMTCECGHKQGDKKRDGEPSKPSKPTKRPRSHK